MTPYRITWEEPFGCYVRFSGPLTPESVARLAHDLTSDPRYDDLRYAIVDLLESPGHSFRRDDRSGVGAAMAEMIGARFSNQRVLEVAIATDPRMLNFIATYATVTTRPFRVFATLDAARDWLSQQTLTLRAFRLSPDA